MTRLLESVREIVDPSRITELPGELTEESATSRCGPVRVRHAGASWALRLKDGDHLPVLAELSKERSVRRLPDYVVFSEPRSPAQRPDDVALNILVCELKSSVAGAASAWAQVQLGKLLAEYLVRVAVHSLGESEVPGLWCCGLIASPELPTNMVAKGNTRPGRVEHPNKFDKLTRMRVYYVPGGGEIHLESFFSS